MKTLPLLFVALAWPLAVHAQEADTTTLPTERIKKQINDTYDLNHDGKVSDWEREQVNFRVLCEMDLNHDGFIDEKDRKLAREKVKRDKEERLAEIKKWDRNGDGKLDKEENAIRLADEARERAKQKPSQATVELNKPMVAY